MIVCFGDIHFRSDKPYFIKAGNDFINWFKDWSYNNEQNSLILAGDLVESIANGGIVIDFLERFYQSSKFKAMHICVGNHDKKKHTGISQLAYEFYRSKKNVFIYEEPTETLIEDCNILILPYFLGTNDYGCTMKEYYSNIYQNKLFSNNYDLVVGHFADTTLAFGGSDCIENLEKINTRVLCLGHIHTRVNPEIYIGSIFAGRKNENDYSRAAWIIDKTSKKEEKLPVFNEFLQVVYPEDLPKSKAINPVYTILNCANEDIAKAKYGDIFIRKVTSSKIETTTGSSSSLERQFESIKNFNVSDLFNEFVKVQEKPIDKSIINRCEKLLVNANYTTN